MMSAAAIHGTNAGAATATPAATLRVEPLRPEWVTAAARLLARAYVTNPLHVAAFGDGELARNEAFFREGLAVMKGPKWVALDESVPGETSMGEARSHGPRVVGVLHWAHSPSCQLHWREKLRLTPAMIEGFGLRSALRVSRWLATWSRHDPSHAHSHLGPIAVDPAFQGRRIGRVLMEHYCRQLDRAGHAGYLETDRPGNVAFYARFGFVTVREVEVLGVRNFMMSREARTGGETR